MTRGAQLQTRSRCLVCHNLVRNAPKVEEERLKFEDQEYTITDGFIRQLYPQCGRDKCSAKQGH